MTTVVVRADRGSSPLWQGEENIDPSTLPLSERLLVALSDWADFFDRVWDGQGNPPGEALEVLHEFAAQGLRLARKVHQELPGAVIHYVDPETGHTVVVGKRAPTADEPSHR